MGPATPEARSAATPDLSTPLDEFALHYDLALAHGDEQRHAVFAFRGGAGHGPSPQAAARNPSAEPEQDACDERSLHCLVTQRSSGEPAGYVRLVRSFDEFTRLPIEDCCPGLLDEAPLNQRALHRTYLSEISRLSVSDGGGGDSPVGLALFFAAVALAQLEERGNCLAMLAPELLDGLERHGVPFTRLGVRVEGLDAHEAVHVSAPELEPALTDELQRFYRAVLEQLGAAIAALPGTEAHRRRPEGGVYWLRAWALRPHPEPTGV